MIASSHASPSSASSCRAAQTAVASAAPGSRSTTISCAGASASASSAALAVGTARQWWPAARSHGATSGSMPPTSRSADSWRRRKPVRDTPGLSPLPVVLLRAARPRAEGVERLVEPLEPLVARRGPVEAVLGGVADLLRGEHRAGARAGGQPAGDIDGGAEPVAPAVDGRAERDPRAQRREVLLVFGAVDEREAGLDRRGELRPDG